MPIRTYKFLFEIPVVVKADPEVRTIDWIMRLAWLRLQDAIYMAPKIETLGGRLVKWAVKETDDAKKAE